MSACIESGVNDKDNNGVIDEHGKEGSSGTGAPVGVAREMVVSIPAETARPSPPDEHATGSTANNKQSLTAN